MRSLNFVYRKQCAKTRITELCGFLETPRCVLQNANRWQCKLRRFARGRRLRTASTNAPTALRRIGYLHNLKGRREGGGDKLEAAAEQALENIIGRQFLPAIFDRRNSSPPSPCSTHSLPWLPSRLGCSSRWRSHQDGVRRILSLHYQTAGQVWFCGRPLLS